MTFNPEAATAAYMATLSPAQHAKATAYTHGGEWLLLWGWLVTIFAAWLILKSGILTRISRRIKGKSAAVAVCVVVFVGLDWLIELPWTIYASWWRERSYGLTTQPFGGWLSENIMATSISMVVTLILALAIYGLMRFRPRSWWIWSGGVALIVTMIFVVITPVVIEPLFNDYKPAPVGPTRTAVVELAKRAGVPSDKILIYNGSKQSQRYTANVNGLFGTARVAMSDTMFQQGADLAEVRGVVGHEMGHYKHGHIFISAFIEGALIVLTLFVADRTFNGMARTLGATGVGGLSDPAGLPVLAVIIATVGLLVTPINTTTTRLQESDADRFSLRTAHEPDGLSKALVKTIAYRASSPGPIEEALFYDHPSVERRVHRAMVWKAANPGLVGK